MTAVSIIAGANRKGQSGLDLESVFGTGAREFVPAPARPMVIDHFFDYSRVFSVASESGTISKRSCRSLTVAPSSINVRRPSPGFA
jgi:hypothetical protein